MDRILIKSDREYLREVFSRIDNGKYAVPSFQRDFIWTEDQVRNLFDSILKGYPIGALTLWHSETSYGYKDIVTDKEISDRVSDYYILDGRQRMTALYGCCIAAQHTLNRKLLLNYDLASEKLVVGKYDSLTIVPMWEIYDTFRMLGRIQKLQQSNLCGDSELFSKYSDRLKEINTILQEYVISEILIEKCSLGEAAEVFSRINSEGTHINQTDMLQALLFGKGGMTLVNKEIGNIKRKLRQYGFDRLPEKVILDCFYRFAGLPFYEKKSKDLSDFDLQDNIPDITNTIVRTAEFLHNKCFVLSSSLLPYSRQFVALSWFFKEHYEASLSQERELVRWFYYTTVKQSFMNGSLTNVRAIFNNFDYFIKGKSETAAIYEPVAMPREYTFRFSSKSALSNLVILLQIIKKKNQPSLLTAKSISYFSFCSSPVGYFPVLYEEEKSFLSDLKYSTPLLFNADRAKLDSFLLSESCLLAFWNGDVALFEEERSRLLNQFGREFLESLSLEFI